MISGDSLRESMGRLEEQLTSTRGAHQQATLAAEVAHLESRVKDATIERLREQLSKLEDESSTMKRALEETRLSNETLRADLSAKEILSKQALANHDDRSQLQAQLWQAEKTRLEQQAQMLEQRATELADHLANAQAAAVSAPSGAQSREESDRIRSLEFELANVRSCVNVAEAEAQKLRTGLETFVDRYENKTLASGCCLHRNLFIVLIVS